MVFFIDEMLNPDNGNRVLFKMRTGGNVTHFKPIFYQLDHKKLTSTENITPAFFHISLTRYLCELLTKMLDQLMIIGAVNKGRVGEPHSTG